LGAVRFHPSPNDICDRFRLLACVEACFFEDFRDLELLESFQRDVFCTHGSGMYVIKRIDIDFLVMRIFLAAKSLDFALTSDDLAVNVLGFFLNRRIDGKQGLL
jgi:hypothetical protein